MNGKEAIQMEQALRDFADGLGYACDGPLITFETGVEHEIRAQAEQAWFEQTEEGQSLAAEMKMEWNKQLHSERGLAEEECENP